MTTHTKLAAPLPCPFCGHVGLDFKEGSTFRWIVAECSGCGASRGETRIQTLGEGTKDEWMVDAKEDAIREWNTRAAALESTERLAGGGEPVARDCEWSNCPHRVGDVCCNEKTAKPRDDRDTERLAGGGEPVAWLYKTHAGDAQAFTNEPPPRLKELCLPLYTTPPPQAERVPLSDAGLATQARTLAYDVQAKTIGEELADMISAVLNQCAAALSAEQLSDEQIKQLWKDHVRPAWEVSLISPVAFARAIERAHGITPKEGT